jgi:hypothetical protein
MRRAAIVSALLLSLAIALLAGVRALANSDRVPETPLASGWPGVASFALLVAGSLILHRVPTQAALLVSLSGTTYVAANWGDKGLSFIVWCLLFLALVALIKRADEERKSILKRNAIHDRIDEELIDGSIRSNALGHVDGR